MNAEILHAFLLKLPHVVETMQWTGKLAFWVGDKAIGGKMVAMLNLDGNGRAVLSYSAGPERYAELLEIEGCFQRRTWRASGGLRPNDGIYSVPKNGSRSFARRTI
jgi:hypothetical protein